MWTFRLLPETALVQFDYAFDLSCSRHLGISGVDSNVEVNAENTP
jgi:hypothetical protein